MNESLVVAGLVPVDLTLSDLANNFCTDMYSYLITILLFLTFYIVYRTELKQYVQMLCDWVVNKTQMCDSWLINWFRTIPNDLEWMFYYMSLTGISLILYFYIDYATTTQKAILYILSGILILHRIIEFITWIAKKFIIMYAKKQMGKITPQMKDIMNGMNGNNPEYNPVDGLKEVKEVKEGENNE